MPATIVTTLLSTAIPAQPGPSFRFRASATNVSVPTGMNFAAFTQAALQSISLNSILVDLANLAAMGGMGCGIGNGLALSSSSGLTVNLATGNAVGPGGLVEVSAATSTTVTDNTVTYIWLTTAGAIAKSSSTSIPTNGAVYLGAATAASGSVTTIDMSGVVYVLGGRPVRTTADLGYPADSPAFPMLGKTTAGAFEWDGVAWRALGTPTRTFTMTGTLTLTSVSAPRQVLDPVSGTKKLLVPSSRIRDGILEVHHSGSGGTIQIRDSDDTATLLSLTTGQRAVLYPSFAPSGGVYPVATAV